MAISDIKEIIVRLEKEGYQFNVPSGDWYGSIPGTAPDGQAVKFYYTGRLVTDYGDDR